MAYQADFYSSLVALHEDLGRTVAANCIRKVLSGYEVSLSNTSIYSAVDLEGTVISGGRNYNFNVEVKERSKTKDQLQRYPDCELRVDKYVRMMKETPEGTELLYCVLLNKSTCYIFNLKRIDWDKVNMVDWKVNKLQVNQNSETKSYRIFQIPTELAWVTLDCTEFYKEGNF